MTDVKEPHTARDQFKRCPECHRALPHHAIGCKLESLNQLNPSMERRSFLKRAAQLATIGGVGLLAGSTLPGVASPVTPNTPWNVQSSIDGTGYLVAIDNSGNFIARNGGNGKIDYSDSDAATTINNAISHA